MNLIFVRHGQSTWNAENKFTGWVNVDLSEKGVMEAEKSGKLIKDLNINIDYFFTSYLIRAFRTLSIISEINNFPKTELVKAWQLNERHYGNLTGLNKEETKKKVGEITFKNYRRSWDISPPPIEQDNPNIKLFGKENLEVIKKKVIKSESLKDTYKRVIPYYEENIIPKLNEGKNILISAHGNSLRALSKYLFKISDNEINNLEIPTGNPLNIIINKNLVVEKANYLDDTRAKKLINI